MAKVVDKTYAPVLVVDDDPDIRQLVRMYLENEGFSVEMAGTGEHAMDRLRAGGPISLVVLDIMLPGISGTDVAQRVRQVSDVPILMLSAKDRDIDKALGLGMGADDYLTKPFSPVELIARVKAMLRRYQSYLRPHEPESIEASGILLDLRQRRAWVRGVEVTLTAKEFDLMQLFMSHRGQVFTRAQIFAHVWGQDYMHDDNTVTVHIRRLRSKVEKDPDEPTIIRTVWGIGYRMEAGPK